MSTTLPNNRVARDQAGILRPVAHAVILDLDDTLFNTSLSVTDLLLPALRRYGVTPEEIERARQAAHRDNNQSLDIVVYITQKCGAEVWDNVKEEYLSKGKTREFLLPGAQAFIDYLVVADIPFGIKTYGNPILQEMKRQVLALPDTVPFHVINHRKKGEMLARMYNSETGRFEIGWLGVAASRVALVENDPTAFEALESYIRTDQVLPVWIPTARDRKKPVPVGVWPTDGLQESIHVLVSWVNNPLHSE